MPARKVQGEGTLSWAASAAAAVSAALAVTAVAAPLGYLPREILAASLAAGATASLALVIALSRRQQRRRGELDQRQRALFSAGEAFAEAQNEVAVAQALVDAAGDAFDATLAWVARWDAGELRAVPVAARAATPELLTRMPTAFVLAADADQSEDPLATCLAQGRSRLISDEHLTTLSSGWATLAHKGRCRSALLLPLRAGKEIWGVATICNAYPPPPETRRLLQTLSRRAGHTLTNLKHRHATISDNTVRREKERAALLDDAAAVAISASEAPSMLRQVLDVIARAEGLVLSHRDGFILTPSAGAPTRFVSAPSPRPASGFVRIKAPAACGNENFGELAVSLRPDIAESERAAVEAWLGRIAMIAALGLARLRGDEGLTASEARYRSILEALGIGYFEVSRSGRFTYANEPAARIFGHTPHELLGATFRTFVDAATQKWLYDIYGAAWRSGGTALADGYPVHRADGSTRLVSSSAVVRHGPLGDAVGFRGILVDETERHLTEQRLRENESLFRALAESSPVAILMHQDFHWIFANGAAETLTGFEREQLVGRPILEVVAPEARAITREQAAARVHGEAEPKPYLSEIVRSDGKHCTVEIFGNQTTYEERPAAVISVIDVTRQRELLHRAQRVAELLDAAEALAAVGSFEWSLSSETLLVSPTFSGLMGKPARLSELPLLEFVACFQEVERLQVEKFLRQAATAAEPREMTVHLAGDRDMQAYLMRAGPQVADAETGCAVVGAIRPLGHGRS